jgi:CRISPR/Cas system-associated exonuclease Cas4 (RecB family)
MKNDKVICSAGKGVVTRKACMECAVSSELRHPDCGIDPGLLVALLDRQDRPDIHVSDLVGCLKRAHLSKKAPEPQYVHSMIYVAAGSAVHSYLEDHDSDFFESEVPLRHEDVLGTADRIYSEGRIIDFKTTRWLKLESLPYGSHSLQLNYYAHMLRKIGRKVTSLAIQYIDLSGPTKCRKCQQIVVPGPFGLECPVCHNTPKGAHLGVALVEVPLMAEEELEKLFESRRKALESALSNGHTAQAEPSFLCGYCEFVQKCNEGLRYRGWSEN